MLKTRRQRSFWARIKLSIILFQTPRRMSDFDNLEVSPVSYFLGTLTCKKKYDIQKHNETLLQKISFFDLFYAYFPYQRCCSLACFFSSFPSLYSQRPFYLPYCFAASVEECITKPFVLSSAFLFFLKLFFHFSFKLNAYLHSKILHKNRLEHASKPF